MAKGSLTGTDAFKRGPLNLAEQFKGELGSLGIVEPDLGEVVASEPSRMTGGRGRGSQSQEVRAAPGITNAWRAGPPFPRRFHGLFLIPTPAPPWCRKRTVTH